MFIICCPIFHCKDQFEEYALLTPCVDPIFQQSYPENLVSRLLDSLLGIVLGDCGCTFVLFIVALDPSFRANDADDALVRHEQRSLGLRIDSCRECT